MASKARVDYYSLLGVPAGASHRQISDAYWRLASERRDQLPLLNEAYEVLSNAQRRLAYDAERGGAPPEHDAPLQRTALQRPPGVREKLNWYLR